MPPLSPIVRDSHGSVDGGTGRGPARGDPRPGGAAGAAAPGAVGHADPRAGMGDPRPGEPSGLVRRRRGAGGVRTPTDRLRHVAQIGVRALPYSFTVHGRAVPAEPGRVGLTLPSGAPLALGPDPAGNVVRGAALDFCLVVTQRRHPADVALEVTGPVAAD